jgi:iron complex transport system substrate-binding protein
VRALIVLLVAACAATALGCQESGFDERKETARPLKVQHTLGESKVPGQAERPVTLTVDTLDDTLALGLRPRRAAVPGRELPAYLRGPAAEVELIAPVTARDLGAVRAADPDVIVGREEAQAALYEQLTEIAPTVMTEGGGGQWKLNLRLVGEALGRTNDAEALLTDYDRRVALVRRSIKGRPKAAVVRRAPDGMKVAGPDTFAATILADTGLRRAASPRAADLVIRGDEATWWGPGGVHAARTALADLQQIVQR